MKGKVKDFLDNPAGFHINNNGVLDFGMSDIPKGHIGKGAFSCGKLGMKCSLDLAACVLGQPFVEQILERNEIGQALVAVHAVGNGDQPNIVEREKFLGQLADLNVVSPQA